MKRVNPAQLESCDVHEGEWKTIGQVANEFKISNRTLRFYEQRGLLQPVKHNDRRFYFKIHTDRVSQIIQYQEAGMSLRRIKEIFCGEGSAEIDRQNKFDSIELECMIDRLRVRREEINVAIDKFESLLAEQRRRTVLKQVTSLLICAYVAFGANTATAQQVIDESITNVGEYKAKLAMLAVMEKLSDPMSSQFKSFALPGREDDNDLYRNSYVCGKVNSKNKFGGYSGFAPFAYDIESNSALIVSDEMLSSPSGQMVAMRLSFTKCDQALGVKLPSF